MALDFLYVNSFMGHLGGGRIDLDSDTFKAVLTNTAPVANTTVNLADITQISNGNGYTTGGVTLTSVTWTEVSAGVWEFDSADFEWIASGGAIGPFRYIAIYSDTSASDRVCGWYDFGSAVTIPNGGTFRVMPGAQGHMRFVIVPPGWEIEAPD